MSTIEDVRKLFQDFLAPELAELAAIKASMEAISRVADARWGAQQSQYSTMMTHMELIRAEVKNNHTIVMNKLDELAKEKV
jgi:hypothetical protein